MSNIFSKFLKDRSGNRPIRMGNQLEHGGVIAQTDSLAVVDEPVRFTSTVDLTDATVVSLPFYTTEIAAIDAGLVPGDKFLLSGVVTTVTNIKQVITLQANLAELIAFTVDVSHLTPTQFYTTYFGSGTLTLVTYDTAQKFYVTGNGLSTLTSLKVGLGYSMTYTSAKTLTIYGKPVNTSYHYPIHSGTNYMAWVDADTDSATALTLFNSIFAYSTTTAGAVISSPATFVKGKAYSLSTLSTTAEQGLPKTSGVGDPTVDAAFATLALATAGGVEVGQVWYNTTSGRLLTRLS